MADSKEEEQAERQARTVAFNLVVTQLNAIVKPHISSEVAAHAVSKRPEHSKLRSRIRSIDHLRAFFPRESKTDWGNLIAAFLDSPKQFELPRYMGISDIVAQAVSYDIAAAWLISLRVIATPTCGMKVVRRAYLDDAMMPNGIGGRNDFDGYLKQNGTVNVSFREATGCLKTLCTFLRTQGLEMSKEMAAYLKLDGYTYLE